MQTYRYNTSKNKILYVILLHWHLIALKCITAMLYVAPLVSLCERLVMLSMYDRQWDIFARRDNRTMQQQRQQQKEKKPTTTQSSYSNGNSNRISKHDCSQVFYQNGRLALICPRLSFFSLSFFQCDFPPHPLFDWVGNGARRESVKKMWSC